MISDILSQFMRDQGLETPLKERRLLDAWEDVAGKIVAQYTQTKFIRNQTLYVKVQNPALRADLGLMKSQLIRRLNDKVGSFVISEIRMF